MRKSEGLYAVSLNILGLSILVQTDDLVLLDQVTKRYCPAVVNEAGRTLPIKVMMLKKSSFDYEVSVGDQSITVPNLGYWPRPSVIIDLIVERANPGLTFLHSSAILVENGGIAFLGSSTAGKSTLVEALESRQYRKIADDCVPVDAEEGLVYAYPGFSPIGGELSTFDTDRFRIDSLFLMNNVPTATAPTFRSMKTGVDCFERLYKLCYGTKLANSKLNTTHYPIRSSIDFAHMPEMREVSFASALQFVLRHSHPSPASSTTRISRAASLLQKVKYYSLAPGHLKETIDLVEETIRNNSN